MNWRFDYNEDGAFVTTTEGEFVCSVHAKTINEEIDRALLIAAAPKLLRGIKKTLETINQGSCNVESEMKVMLETLVKEASEGPTPTAKTP